MKESKLLFVGIDLDENKAMVSFYHEGMEGMETAEAKADFPENPYLYALEKDAVPFRQQLAEYVGLLIGLKEEFAIEDLPLHLSVCVPEITKDVAELFSFVQEELGIAKEHFCLMDRKESFFAYAYHQEPSVCRHDVALFDFSGTTLQWVLLHAEGGANRRVTATSKSVTVPAALLTQPVGKDAFFADILKECFHKKIVSGVYLLGDGFDGEWLKESLRAIGPNRRVFRGKNLYPMGACYKGYRMESTAPWPYYFDGEYKLQGEVSLKILHNGKPVLLRLCALGENWFAPTKPYFFLYDDDPLLEVQVRVRAHAQIARHAFVLEGLPVRQKRSIRIGLQAEPLSSRAVRLHLWDDGFGDFFASTGKTWDFEVLI